MNIFQLKCFKCIAETGSFSETAFELFISQSSVSKSIAKLENELGVSLFHRVASGAKLTPAGEIFKIHADAILREYEYIRSDLKNYQSKTEICFGCLENITRNDRIDMISSFKRENPDIRLRLLLSHSFHLLDLLKDGKANPVLVMLLTSSDGKHTSLDDRKISEYKSYHLSEDEYMVVVSNHHPLAQKKKITWADILQEPLIFFDHSYSLRRMLEDTFQQHKSKPNVVVECNSVENILELVALNAGITLLPASISMAGYQVTAVQIEQPIIRHEILLLRKDTENKHAVQKLVNFILTYRPYSQTE